MLVVERLNSRGVQMMVDFDRSSSSINERFLCPVCNKSFDTSRRDTWTDRLQFFGDNTDQSVQRYLESVMLRIVDGRPSLASLLAKSPV